MRLLSLLGLLLLAPAASAQLAVGGQVGDPTGLALKFGAGRGAVLIGVGWDLDESVSAEGHYVLRANRLSGTRSDVRLFYGPGVFLQSSENRDPQFGVSLGVGLEALLTDDIEIYGLVSPRLQLVEETDFDLGGGIGLRLRL